MDNPLRLLVTLEMRTSSDEYSAIRAELAEFAWRAVIEIVSRRLFPDVKTFPGWVDPAEMADFGFLHVFWPISRPNVICLRINRSPIDDLIVDDPQELSAKTLDPRPTLNVDSALEYSHPLACVRSLLSMRGLVRAMAALVADYEPRPVLVADAEEAVRLLHRSLVGIPSTPAPFGSAVAVMGSGEG